MLFASGGWSGVSQEPADDHALAAEQLERDSRTGWGAAADVAAVASEHEIGPGLVERLPLERVNDPRGRHNGGVSAA